MVLIYAIFMRVVAASAGLDVKTPVHGRRNVKFQCQDISRTQCKSGALGKELGVNLQDNDDETGQCLQNCLLF